MKIHYLASLAIASTLALGAVYIPMTYQPSAQANPCAANPCAAAAQKIPEIYTDPQAKNNLAIRGYDPVAYFTQGKPVVGKANYQYQWKGATWRFANAKHLNQFKANPTAYAPQYGGYCAKGLSEGHLVSTVPQAWKIVNGKLYLNFSQDVQKQWLSDVSGNIAKANQKWPKILKTANEVYYDTVGAVKY